MVIFYWSVIALSGASCLEIAVHRKPAKNLHAETGWPSQARKPEDSKLNPMALSPKAEKCKVLMSPKARKHLRIPQGLPSPQTLNVYPEPPLPQPRKPEAPPKSPLSLFKPPEVRARQEFGASWNQHGLRCLEQRRNCRKLASALGVLLAP